MNSVRRKRVKPATVSYGDVALTLRELDMAQLIFSGMTNKEAADTLLLSKRQIDWCMAGLRAKLGVKNRPELFARLRELGVIK